MKNKIKTVIITGLCVCGLATQLSAAQAQPGSAEDPLVTKSYVDGKISQITGVSPSTGTSSSSGNEAIVNDVLAQLEIIYGISKKVGTGSANTSSSSSKPEGEAFEPVFASAGQIVVGLEGAEIILRSGKAVAYCPGENGVINVSKGIDLKNGDEVDLNNMLIVPRSDGRGISATTDIWVIIKGGYEIK